MGSCEGAPTSLCAVVDMVAMLPKFGSNNQQLDKPLEEYHMVQVRYKGLSKKKPLAVPKYKVRCTMSRERELFESNRKVGIPATQRQ